MEAFITYLVETVSAMGYGGIFLLMFIESTFFPLPSEIIMIPAGYLAYKGDMNVVLVILAGVLGSIGGALFNYYFALALGRKFILRYGKYFFIKEGTFLKMEKFYLRHGSFSTFTGRLIPAVRHLISIPAGLTRMHMGKFITYTMLGATIWVVVLTYVGYIVGHSELLVKEYMHIVMIGLALSLLLMAGVYVFWLKRKLQL